MNQYVPNPSGALEQHLMRAEYPLLQRYVSHFLSPDGDRPLILAAHAVVERLLGDMIAIKLSRPAIWLDEADFRSRTNLASALGLISDKELNMCRVLNSARNFAAHGLEPLPDKWRTEIMRLGKGINEDGPGDLREALLNIVASVGGPWLYARICNAIITLPTLLDQHRERWIELMDERLKNHPDPDKVQLMAERLIKEHSDSETVQADHDELMQLAEEINIALLKEVKATEGP